MLSRRIIPGLCALALAAPATAGAKPVHHQPSAQRGAVAYGDTKYDLQNQQDLKAPAGRTAYEQAISGDTKGDLPRAIAPEPTNATTDVDKIGSLTPEQLAAAYGTTKPAAPARASVASDDDGTNGWQIAAYIETGLLAAFAIGAAVLLSGRRRRAPRMGV